MFDDNLHCHIFEARSSAIAEEPRDALSVEVLSTAAQRYGKSHLKRLGKTLLGAPKLKNGSRDTDHAPFEVCHPLSRTSYEKPI